MDGMGSTAFPSRASAYRKSQRSLSMAEGRCPNHAGRMLRPGKKSCDLCATSFKISNDRLYIELKAKGLCSACHRDPVKSGKTRCSPCVWSQGEKFLLKQYGLSLEAYARMEHAQDRRCGVAGCVFRASVAGKKYQLHVDHDHTTGKVRGLICNLCNVALGQVRDRPEILSGLLAYLVRK